MLGVDKFRLINFYGKYGLQYITDPVDKYADSEKKLLSYYESKEREHTDGSILAGGRVCY